MKKKTLSRIMRSGSEASAASNRTAWPTWMLSDSEA